MYVNISYVNEIFFLSPDLQASWILQISSQLTIVRSECYKIVIAGKSLGLYRSCSFHKTDTNLEYDSK